MNYRNPTALQIGMSGTLLKQSYRVAGRVVLGMEEAGETYYWNEFNLVTPEGQSATLVYEADEEGSHWRLFTQFEPDYPITAEDAASKQIGDRLNLGWTEVQVTLVSSSRVYHIEGEAPEGVEVGDIARYFNARSGATEVVISWTGEEVECYQGEDLAPAVVSQAFGLQSVSSPAFANLAGAPGAPSRWPVWLAILGALLGIGVVAAGYAIFRNIRPAGATVLKAGPGPLRLGNVGSLNGTSYRLSSHTLVHIAQVGLRYERHEYQLLAEDGSQALLVCGLKPGGKDWCLFTPFSWAAPLTPAAAAALRQGDTVRLQDDPVLVTQLYQSTVRQSESAELPDLKSRAVLYGFIARSGQLIFIVQWDQTSIEFYRGQAVEAKDVLAVFSLKPPSGQSAPRSR